MNAPANPWRVLVVDDDRMMHRLVGTYLKSQPCTVTHVNRAEEALELLREQSFDLIISDRDMPGGMPGTELAERVESIVPRMGFILMSGSILGGEPDLAHIDHFLPKPFTREKLVETMERVMAMRGA